MRIEDLKKSAGIDTWFNENEAFQKPAMKEVERAVLLEDKIDNQINIQKKIIFIDGKQRSHLALLSYVSSQKIIFSEVNCGACIYERDIGTKLLFSPELPPKRESVAIFPKQDYEYYFGNSNQERVVFIGRHKFIVRNAEEREVYDVLEHCRNSLEEESVKEMNIEYPDILKIKDGKTSTIFYSGDKSRYVGVIGLVKSHSIYYESIENLLKLKSCSRTKLLAIDTHKEEFQKALSYIKLVDAPGLTGIIRVEAIIKREYDDDIKRVIGIFNYLASELPRLTKLLPIPRSPENIFPVQCIEEHLKYYFMDTSFLKSNITLNF